MTLEPGRMGRRPLPPSQHAPRFSGRASTRNSARAPCARLAPAMSRQASYPRSPGLRAIVGTTGNGPGAKPTYELPDRNRLGSLPAARANPRSLGTWMTRSWLDLLQAFDFLTQP